MYSGFISLKFFYDFIDKVVNVMRVFIFDMVIFEMEVVLNVCLYVIFCNGFDG